MRIRFKHQNTAAALLCATALLLGSNNASQDIFDSAPSLSIQPCDALFGVSLQSLKHTKRFKASQTNNSRHELLKCEMEIMLKTQTVQCHDKRKIC
jgi:hypothetical protein